jgi:type II secretory pathway component GspD/PulD (secretin)
VSRANSRPGDRRNGAWRALGWTLCALVYWSVAVAQQLATIELRYRLADEIVPIVQPLVEAGGVVTGSDHLLFVRTSPSNLEQIRQAVAALDRKPRQLTVSVGQGTVSDRRGTDVRGAGSVGNDELRVSVNAPPGSANGVAVAARAGSRQTSIDNVSSVRTIEGSETWIGFGHSVPITTTQVVPDRRGAVEYSSTGYRDVSTGFYATVRVSGEFVTLEIAPRQQRLQGSPGAPVIATAGSVTSVRGRLGEWIPLGAVSESATRDSSGLLVRGHGSETPRYTTWVKVEDVP